ncbi:MAG: hypothetical protein JJU42_06600 [Rhodobacteraceae bacterium]|nr:hypothetical protein [Paracoccaceae bacterium]
MLLEFIAVVAAAFAAGGLALVANHLSRGRLPGWAPPFAAAGGIIAMIIYLEYTWADRVEAALPPGVVVAQQNTHTAWFRPWSYVFPLSNRITAVDHRMRLTHSAQPDLVLTGVILQERWALNFGVQVVFDCANARRMDVTSATRFTEEGVPEGGDWFNLSPEDPVLREACEGGEHGGRDG